jgi:hypothetical protein
MRRSFLALIFTAGDLQRWINAMANNIEFRNEKQLPEDQVISLYTALEWSSAKKPKELLNALRNSHSVVSAWDGEK